MLEAERSLNVSRLPSRHISNNHVLFTDSPLLGYVGDVPFCLLLYAAFVQWGAVPEGQHE
jgi:hypothetical protein